jgi:predicted small metal-binding protein
MSSHLSLGTQAASWTLRCECGAEVSADSQKRLVEQARRHFREFHPDLGANFSADIILAMAEQRGDNL